MVSVNLFMVVTHGLSHKQHTWKVSYTAGTLVRKRILSTELHVQALAAADLSPLGDYLGRHLADHPVC